MKNKEAESILDTLLTDARAAGAEAADAVLYHAVSHGVSWRMGNLEDVERSESADLGLRIMVGKRQASVSTTDQSRASLKELVTRCAAMAKGSAGRPLLRPGASRNGSATAPFKKLDLGDYAEPSTEELESPRRQNAKRPLSPLKASLIPMAPAPVMAKVKNGSRQVTDFFGQSGGSNHSVSVSVLAQDENGMERDYDYDSKTHIIDLLLPAAGIGKNAGERTVRRLSPKENEKPPRAQSFLTTACRVRCCRTCQGPPMARQSHAALVF